MEDDNLYIYSCCHPYHSLVSVLIDIEYHIELSASGDGNRYQISQYTGLETQRYHRYQIKCPVSVKLPVFISRTEIPYIDALVTHAINIVFYVVSVRPLLDHKAGSSRPTQRKRYAYSHAYRSSI